MEKTTKKFSPELRERAVRLVLEQQREHESQWGAINSVATKIGGSGETLREVVRETKPRGAFDARAIRELYKAAPADPKGLRRTIRRSELRQIVPLADSTIYELERRGEFPQRFFLTARCVVWDLGEVLAWIQSRRHAGSNAMKKAPVPDLRRRKGQAGADGA